jgi:hypothetical protein
MWPVALLAFGMAAPEKTIHYGGGFTEDGKVGVFRKQTGSGRTEIAVEGSRQPQQRLCRTYGAGVEAYVRTEDEL